MISVGDIIAIAGVVGAVAGNYFATVRRVDSIDFKLEELRKGRGLILEHWPYAFQRLMGFRNGKE